VERILGLIPKVYVLRVVGGEDEYSVLVTERHTLFVLEKEGGPPEKATRFFFAPPTTPPGTIDLPRVDVDPLLENPKNLAIPHDAVRMISLKKVLFHYELYYEYLTRGGRTKTFYAIVKPPPEAIKLQQKAGVRWGSIFRDYARRAQYLLDGTLPEQVAKRCEWGS